MRNAIVKMPVKSSIGERHHELSAAVRQLDRAEVYLASVAYMDLGDPAVDRTVSRMRSELDGLRRHIIHGRDGIHA